MIKTYDIIQKKSEMEQCGQFFGIPENFYGTVRTLPAVGVYNLPKIFIMITNRGGLL